MTKFYATIDAEEGTINQNADIVSFDTRAEAEAYLRSGYDATEWAVEIEEGRFGDCWIKCHSEPKDAYSVDVAPFVLEDLTVRAPGQHPGGRQWWLEPQAEVLVAVPRWIGDND